jgi:hypothetical protein
VCRRKGQYAQLNVEGKEGTDCVEAVTLVGDQDVDTRKSFDGGDVVDLLEGGLGSGAAGGRGLVCG